MYVKKINAIPIL